MLVAGPVFRSFGMAQCLRPQKVADNYFEEGKKAYEKKDFNLAITNYNEAIKLNPTMGRMLIITGGLVTWQKAS